MAVRYICKNCGKIIAEVVTKRKVLRIRKPNSVEPMLRTYVEATLIIHKPTGVETVERYMVMPSLSELKNLLGGRCPFCGHRIGDGFDPYKDITISVTEHKQE